MREPTDAELTTALSEILSIWPEKKDRLRFMYERVQRWNPTWSVTLEVKLLAVSLRTLCFAR